MSSTRRSRAAMLALLGSSGAITADRTEVVVDETPVGIKTAVADDALPGVLADEADADATFAVVSSPKSDRRFPPKKPKGEKPDVGVLSAHHRRTQDQDWDCKWYENCDLKLEEKNLQECLSKCPNSPICLESSMEKLELACRMGDHKTCLTPDNTTTFELYYCPLAECASSLGTKGTFGEYYFTEKDYSNFEMCATCVTKKKICQFCDAGGSNRLCDTIWRMYNFGTTSQLCAYAKDTKKVHYRANCTGFSYSTPDESKSDESKSDENKPDENKPDENNTSSDAAALSSAVALAIVSMGIMN